MATKRVKPVHAILSGVAGAIAAYAYDQRVQGHPSGSEVTDSMKRSATIALIPLAYLVAHKKSPSIAIGAGVGLASGMLFSFMSGPPPTEDQAQQRLLASQNQGIQRAIDLLRGTSAARAGAQAGAAFSRTV